jgi:hypothetical protein
VPPHSAYSKLDSRDQDGGDEDQERKNNRGLVTGENLGKGLRMTGPRPPLRCETERGGKRKVALCYKLETL